MSIQLSLEDRYYLSMYTRRLPCTLKLRFAVDAFLESIDIKSDEATKYEVSINQETYQFKCNDSNYKVVYDDFPIEVTDAMRSYIRLYDHEQNINNVLLHNTIDSFKKVI